jgi:beta-glucosidase
MDWMGVGAYRFSIAWPRIYPEGRGTLNVSGLDFYDSLVDALLEAGIRPFATLYHWDLPQALQDGGGWPARATAEAFAEYADLASRCLGDRVRFWTTLNEPFISAFLGYRSGEHAPGRRDPAETLPAAHHLLLAHGLAVPILRANSPGAQVGIALNLLPQVPASPSAADVQAAREQDGLANRWFLDPLVGRGYPADMIAWHGDPLAFARPGDLEAIAAPLDFLGVNYYNRAIVRSTAVPEQDNLPRAVVPEGEPTAMDWEVYPRGLTDILVRVHGDYAFPALYVTENGAAYPDPPALNGRVDDPRRQAYLEAHLAAAAEALARGVPLRGYFVWSLLDNFEWAFGYSRRFGIVHVDFASQRRTVKASGHWYGQVIAQGGLVRAG